VGGRVGVAVRVGRNEAVTVVPVAVRPDSDAVTVTDGDCVGGSVYVAVRVGGVVRVADGVGAAVTVGVAVKDVGGLRAASPCRYAWRPMASACRLTA